MKSTSQENFDEPSFDKSFMLLCHNPNESRAPSHYSDMSRISKSFNHINLPISNFGKFNKVPKFASNDNELNLETNLALTKNNHFERKSILAKTMIPGGGKEKVRLIESNNFVRDSVKFLPGSKGTLLSDDLNDSRRNSQINPALHRKSHFNKEEVNVFKVAEGKKKNQKIERLENFIDSNLFQLLITSLIMYALFGTDLNFYFFTKEQDFVFDILTFISLGVFTLEIVLSIISKKSYLFSFFFWLDLLSTLTLVLDLSWVDQAIL